MKPSSFYRSELWRLGLFSAKAVPSAVQLGAVRCLSQFYWLVNRTRREITIQNILPGVGNDRAAARRLSRQLFQNFAQKLVDLWRYETGLPIDHLFHGQSNWDQFEMAQRQKRGVLLITPHLGNWEFGGPLLAKKGVTLQVISLEEPQEKFTRLRESSRKRWGIETIVIGKNPFAFVDVIRRLEEGATVALLVDRPPPQSAVIVDMFGGEFQASIAAAEMARATGCVLLPALLPRDANGYSARLLPQIDYDRRLLGKREERVKLTQQMMTMFAPAIKAHLDQWYHFVPVWKQPAP